MLRMDTPSHPVHEDRDVRLRAPVGVHLAPDGALQRSGNQIGVRTALRRDALEGSGNGAADQSGYALLVLDIRKPLHRQLRGGYHLAAIVDAKTDDDMAAEHQPPPPFDAAFFL